MSLTADVARTYRTREVLEALIADARQLGPDYQPVRRLEDGSLVGVKATGRGSPGSDLADTLSLLDGARTLGLVERLDWAFRALAFDDLAGRSDLELHLTPEPETFGTPCPPRFAAALGRARRELRVAAEIHADAFADAASLSRGLTEIRQWGWQVVLTDVADDPTALDHAAQVSPDVVQVDLRLPGRATGGQSSGVRRLLSLAADRGAVVMALGVDTPGARLAAVELGCTLGRGTELGAPGPLPPR